MHSTNFKLVNSWAGQLAVALREVGRSPEKGVYQTDHGIRALTASEARVDSNFQKIPYADETQAVSVIINSLNLSTNAADQHAQISKAFAMIVHEYAPKIALDHQRLYETAEVAGYGYKLANLDQVSEICQEDYGAYRVEVPAYMGFSSDTVQQWLLDGAGLDLAKRWADIVTKHFPEDQPELQQTAMKSKKLPQPFLEDCAILRRDLTVAFGLLLAKAETSLGADPKFTSLMKSMQARNERLMVRSSGKEDTAEFANAGGNASVPNVIPAAQDILRAMEEVVNSYLGERSLKQRLGAADPSLFKPELLTPVLVQRMIGEQNSGAMPTCGVMFSEDCESRTSAETTRGTTGITVIQAAYGHNEAVVNSLIPVDTYYVNHENQSIVVARPKTHRMVPSQQSGELVMAANSEESANQLSLPADAVRTLKSLARRFEQAYGGPVDVEFVVDNQAKKIYVVQVRPLVHRGHGAQASYIADANRLGSHELVRGNAIGTAGGGLRRLQAKEMIVASTLSEAYSRYQQHDAPDSVKAVVVGNMAPSTSHWATIFRNADIPVVCIPALPKVQAWVAKPSDHFIISPQQGTVIYFGEQEPPTLADLNTQGISAMGWVDYPAPAMISVSAAGDPLTMAAIEDVFLTLRHSPEKRRQFEALAKSVKMDEVFERLPTMQGEELNAGLALLLFVFKDALEPGLPDPEEKQRCNALQRQALALARNIKANGHWPAHHANYARKLLPIHFLRALVYAQPTADEVVGADSLANALRNKQEEQTIAAELSKQGIVLKHPVSLPLMRMTKYALTPKIAEGYRAAIAMLDAEGRGDLLEGLAVLVVKLNRLDMLVCWLNIVFPTTPDVAMLLQHQIAQEPLLNQLTEQRKRVSALSIPAFGMKKAFSTQWDVFNAFLRDVVPMMAGAFTHADAMGRFAVLALMQKIVDQADLAIKSIEGSSEFTMDEKLNRFQQMLLAYHQIAELWVDKFDLPKNLKKQIGYRLREIKRVIQKYRLTAEDLQFSPDFDLVSFGTSTRKNSEYIEKPRSLEDAFSATHRELLSLLNMLVQRMDDVAIPAPAFMQEITQKVVLGLAGGIELNARGLTANYTKTLGSHGVQYRLHQPIGGQTATLSVRFTAQNERCRWDLIKSYMLALKLTGKFDLSDFESSQGGLGFTFHLDANDDLGVLKDILLRAETFSTNEVRGGMEKIILDPFIVRNPNKTLDIASTPQIIEIFESHFGFSGMFMQPFLQQMVNSSLQDNPSIAERLLERAWLLDDNTPLEQEDFESTIMSTQSIIAIRIAERIRNKMSQYTNQVLPMLLVDQGRFLEAIAQRGLALCRGTSESQELGFGLLKAVGEKDSSLLPGESAWYVFLSLLYNPSNSNALALMNDLDGRGAEQFKQSLIANLRQITYGGRDIVEAFQRFPQYHTREIFAALGELSREECKDFMLPLALFQYRRFAPKSEVKRSDAELESADAGVIAHVVPEPLAATEPTIVDAPESPKGDNPARKSRCSVNLRGCSLM